MKRNQIDFWRLLFMFCVLCLHSGALLTEGYPEVYFKGGYIAVEFFFIISGYYLAESAKQIKPKSNLQTIGTETVNYVFSRAKRMYPEFICGFCLTILLDYIIYHNLPDILEKLFSSGIFELLLLHMFNPYTTPILSIAWYLSALLLATFLIYPCLRTIPDIFKNILAPLIIAGYILFAGSSAGNDIVIGNTQIYWGGYMMGGSIRAIAEVSLGTFLFERVQTLKQHHKDNIMPLHIQVLASIVEIICFGTVIVGAFFYGNTSKDFISLILLSIGCVICLSEIDIRLPLLSDKALAFCASFSYALYMTHRRVVNLSKMILPKETYPIRLSLYIILAILFSLVTYTLCSYWRKKGKQRSTKII